MSTSESIRPLAFARIIPQTLLDRIRDVLLNPTDDESTEESKANRQFILSTYTLADLDPSGIPVVCVEGAPIVSRETLVAAHAAAGHGTGWEAIHTLIPYAPQDMLEEYIEDCFLCSRQSLRAFTEPRTSYTSPSPDKGKGKAKATLPPMPPNYPEFVQLPSESTSTLSTSKTPTTSKKLLFDDNPISPVFMLRTPSSQASSSSSLFAPAPMVSTHITTPPTPVRRSSGTPLLLHSSPEPPQDLPFSGLRLPVAPKPVDFNDSPSQPGTSPASTSASSGRRRSSGAFTSGLRRFESIIPARPSTVNPPRGSPPSTPIVTTNATPATRSTRPPLVNPPLRIPDLSAATITSGPSRPAPLSIRQYSSNHPVVYVRYQGLPDGWQYYLKTIDEARKVFSTKTADESAALATGMRPKPGDVRLPRLTLDFPYGPSLAALHHTTPSSLKLPLELQRLAIPDPLSPQRKQESVDVFFFGPSLPDIFMSFLPPEYRNSQPYTVELKEDVLEEIPQMKPTTLFPRDPVRGWVLLPEVVSRPRPPPPQGDLGAHIKLPPLGQRPGSQPSPGTGRFLLGVIPPRAGPSKST